MRLVFASNNAHKLEEVRSMVPDYVSVLSLRDICFEAEIEETGQTLEENSAIKAETVREWIIQNPTCTNQDDPIDGVFADDTGLEIDVLGGVPGVYTARWAMMSGGVKDLTNEQEIFAANRSKALRELEGKADRGAQFRTVITLIKLSDGTNRHQNSLIQVEGVVRGRIAEKEYGTGGFGYDPVFIPEGYDKTFGELPAEIKNQISHRARALEALVKEIKSSYDQI